MGKLVLWRHAKSTWNAKNIFTGWVDIGLSEEGIAEAIKTGKTLQKYTFDAIYVSQLFRTHMTVGLAFDNVVFGEQEGMIPMIKSEALNERHYGELQGKNKDEIRKQYGDEQFLRWRRSYDEAPPGGESLAMTVARALPYCEKEIFPRVRRGETILVCAHGNSLRGIIMQLEGLTHEEVVQTEIATGEIKVYDLF